MSSLQGADALHRRFAAIARTDVLVREIIIHGVREAKILVPRRTGNLGRTIRPGIITRNSGEVMAGGRNGVGYAAAVEQGTGPHIIKPRNRKVLAWGGARRLSGSLRTGAKATNFATIVHHPGNKAHPYLVPGLQKAANEQGVQVIIKLWNDAG